MNLLLECSWNAESAQQSSSVGGFSLVTKCCTVEYYFPRVLGLATSTRDIIPAHSLHNPEENGIETANMATSVDAKLLKSTKFPVEFNQKVDMQKVNVEVLKK